MANLRKNEIHIEEEKMKKYAHIQRYVENLLKLKYNVADSYELYDLQDLRASGEMDELVASIYAANQEKARQEVQGQR